MISGNLNKHLKTMHKTEENEIIQCDKCANTFNNFDYSKRHQRIMHESNISKFNCYICGKDYTSMQYSKIHIKTLHRKERVACDKCDSTFNVTSSLTKHLKHAHQES